MICIKFPYGMEENTHMDELQAEQSSSTPSILAQSGPSKGECLLDSQWVTFGNRVTFTFAFGNDVGSVHFDRSRGEIFFKGHNIRNFELEDWQWQILEKMRNVLTSHAKLRNFINPYSRLLEKIVLEKSKKSKR